MAFFFRFPSPHPYRSRGSGFRAPASCDFFDELWREIGLAQDHIQKSWYETPQGKANPPKTAQIAFFPLNQFKPEEISIDVGCDEFTVHGQHRLEGENGFESSEFKKTFKLPPDVDPASVTSRATKDGFLVIEGTKRQEEKKSDDSKFEAKLDLRGFKPDDIEIKVRGKELKVTAKNTCQNEGCQLSRDFSLHRCILLPDDVDPSSVTSRLSKEGLLSIEALRDPALLSRERTVDVTAEVDEPEKQQPLNEASDVDTKEK